jgi:hypothetical protein
MRRLFPTFLLATFLLATAPAFAQLAPTHTPPQQITEATADPLASLDFLLGTWSATTAANGSAAAQAIGTYTFARDLNGHELVRTGSLDQCKGPAAFDCQHHDHLLIFSDPNARAVHGSSLLAFYADSEGHIIYYTVSTPDSHTAIFNSQGPPTAPKFRLSYHLEGIGPKAIMTGKFQFAPPGSDDFHSYLEWTGARQ